MAYLEVIIILVLILLVCCAFLVYKNYLLYVRVNKLNADLIAMKYYIFANNKIYEQIGVSCMEQIMEFSASIEDYERAAEMRDHIKTLLKNK